MVIPIITVDSLYSVVKLIYVYCGNENTSELYLRSLNTASSPSLWSFGVLCRIKLPSVSNYSFIFFISFLECLPLLWFHLEH